MLLPLFISDNSLQLFSSKLLLYPCNFISISCCFSKKEYTMFLAGALVWLTSVCVVLKHLCALPLSFMYKQIIDWDSLVGMFCSCFPVFLLNMCMHHVNCCILAPVDLEKNTAETLFHYIISYKQTSDRYYMCGRWLLYYKSRIEKKHIQ